MLFYPLRNQFWRSLREYFSKKESKSRWRFLNNLIRLYWALSLKDFFSSSTLGKKWTFSSILISKKLELKAMKRIFHKLGNGNIRLFGASVGIRFVLNSLSQLSMIPFAFTPTRNNQSFCCWRTDIRNQSPVWHGDHSHRHNSQSAVKTVSSFGLLIQIHALLGHYHKLPTLNMEIISRSLLLNGTWMERFWQLPVSKIHRFWSGISTTTLACHYVEHLPHVCTCNGRWMALFYSHHP